MALLKLIFHHLNKMSIVDENNSYSQDIIKYHGKCGIITARLVDPLSQLINKICGIPDDDINCVGFYYHNISNFTVLLFNIYDNDSVPWLRLGYTIESLLSSPFVSKIIFYPLIKGKNKLVDLFKTITSKIVLDNSKKIYDKDISYTHMLLKLFNLHNSEDISLTGYTLVNKVLLKIMNIEKIDYNKISTNIISCPLLESPVSIVAPIELHSDKDIRYIVEESRREITKLIAVFIDLFTTHEKFRTSFIKYSTYKSSKIDRILDLNNELINHISHGIENGILSNYKINEIIINLNKETSQNLPIISNCPTNIEIKNTDMLCTFSDSICDNIDNLKNLGNFIIKILETIDKQELITIDLNNLINIYNKLIKEKNLPVID